MQSALARPENLAAYGDPDVAALAASYALASRATIPFIDGNKRTAYVVCELFLALNGHVLTHQRCGDSTLTFLALAAGDLTEDALADWIRANIAAA